MTRHPIGARGAEVRSSGVRVDRADGDVGVAEARRHFGGVDWLATLAGLLAAIGTLVLLGGLAGAAGSIGYQLTDSGDDPSIGALVAGIVVLLVSFFVGGWVAGRVARYDGGRNGFLTALWFLALAAALAGLGAWLGDRYDVFREIRLPQWFSGDDLGAAAIASGVVGAVLALAAGWLGGTVGARYHRRADQLVAHTRDGGVLAGQTPHLEAVGGRGRVDVAGGRETGASTRRAR